MHGSVCPSNMIRNKFQRATYWLIVLLKSFYSETPQKMWIRTWQNKCTCTNIDRLTDQSVRNKIRRHAPVLAYFLETGWSGFLLTLTVGIMQFRRTDTNIMIVGTTCFRKEGAMGYYRTGHWDEYHGIILNYYQQHWVLNTLIHSFYPLMSIALPHT